jgi:DNA repair protein RecN (Recombination protein N)
VIEELRIENVGVIARAHLELAPSLTVITGETGAGKTMVLTGLSLLLGGRADPGLVRPGADRAVVEGVVVDPAPAVRERAQEAGARLDDDALLIVRSVPAQGRSRAWLGGQAVPQALLAEVAAGLVTVHGQADQLRLRAPAQQRAALDEVVGAEHQETLARYRDAYAERVAARADLDAWDTAAVARDEELRALTAGLAEVDALAPQPGEDVALKEESDRLGHVEELRAAAEAAYGGLSGDGDDGRGGRGPAVDAAAAVEGARRALEQAADVDPLLKGWGERLKELGYLIADLVVELRSYLTDLEADPARLAAVHERRAALAEAVRRHVQPLRGGLPAPLDGAGRHGLHGSARRQAPSDDAPGVDDLIAWAGTARARVAELTDPSSTREALERRLADAEAAVQGLASAVTAGRERAAQELASAVEEELAGLAMPGARLEARLTPRDEPGPWGAEDVELLLRPHPGAPARPLSRGASGGELSRVMLALEVALAGASGSARPPTFVFDEVDAGVGGRAAVEVGRRLAALARSAQVVVVTHLAQVAAFADRHLVVTKTTREGEDVVTDSGVAAVEGEDRVRELARMLSGQEDSTAALRHAEELLARASVRA